MRLCAAPVRQTGDCGFMMFFQQLARSVCELPCFMSPLAQLPSITCAFNEGEQIAIDADGVAEESLGKATTELKAASEPARDAPKVTRGEAHAASYSPRTAVRMAA